jgi:5-methylcytosine-specific restriction enzyme subunit McrC
MHQPVHLTLFEHEERAYSAIAGFARHSTRRERLFAAIEQVNQAAGREVLSLGRKSLKANGQVGLFRAGDLYIEILPKIDELVEMSTGSLAAAFTASRNLLVMLSYAADLPVHDLPEAMLQQTPGAWVEALIRLFTNGLLQQVQMGLPHQHFSLSETLPVLRGRWEIQRQVARAGLPTSFDVTYETFSADTPLNQVLRLAVEQIRILTQDKKNRRALDILSQWFEPVTRLTHFSPRLFDGIQFDRLNERFRPAFHLARLFLSGNTVDFSPGQQETAGLLFDMGALFEQFIAAFLLRHRANILPQGWDDVDMRVQSAGSRIHLAKTESGPILRLQPDLIFRRGAGAPLLIADTKYKRLSTAQRRTGIAPEDAYQMLAYATRLGCPTVMLLYPETPAGGPVRRRLEIEPTGQHLHACTVNLNTDLTKPERLVSELHGIFGTLT